ncbi:MAG TPA: NAD-dependent epimerase/dehydratase family protein [Gemmatimonadales bacterium]|nr:NAD-dependent epimerase/dehydratase family protein [Gemmatimonadales bacterium]
MPDVARTALVTGASGFVGSHLVEALLDRGWEVRCLVRRTSDLRWLPRERVRLVYGDVGDESASGREALAAAVKGSESVFHLAAVTSAARDATYYRVNVDGTRRLAMAVRESAPDAHIVLCSSLAAAGPPRPGHPATEKDSDNPQGAYGTSKLLAEKVLGDSGLRHVVVRPPAVYGPRDVDILAAFRLASRGLAVRLAPEGQRLSFVHARDLASGLLLAAEREASGMYYLSDGQVHLWEDVMTGIGAAIGRVLRTVSLPTGILHVAARLDRTRALLLGRKPLLTPDRARELSGADWSCSDALARAELGYESRIPLLDGLFETAEWYRKVGWLG